MATTSSGRLVKTSIQLTPEQHRWLTELARAAGETFAVMVRQCVREKMERQPSTVTVSPEETAA